MQTARAQLQGDGYALVRGAVDTADCAALAAVFTAPPPRGGQRDALGDIAGQPGVAALHELAAVLMQAPAQAVRAILFDKSPQANWGVAWHRDLGIAVRERHELPAYRNWSIKEGVWHVQPPPEILRGMLTLRLHLDDCGGDNGALRVIPGSHLDEAPAPAQAGGICCAARTGDVLAMRPSLLHASRKAARPQRRRVLHVEYAAAALPAPLRWACA